ncbi:hypothetical protein [Rhizobium sp. WYJ-E13]|uniref:hypothetical protein n=1 Tax=Rhizobium sp. WYJ-E13 TaxID=2849093 RepID=UPI0020A7A7AB|nr:hypothetical protein [Rhizobium sp. WYJ-E13]
MTAHDQVHGPSPCRLNSLALAATIILSAIGPISCAVVDATTVGSTEKNVVVVRVPHATKALAYGVERKIITPTGANATEYPGSAPYICSPSGFGQKSRCFARSSLMN